MVLMDGYEAARQVRALLYTLPSLFVIMPKSGKLCFLTLQVGIFMLIFAKNVEANTCDKFN